MWIRNLLLALLIPSAALTTTILSQSHSQAQYPLTDPNSSSLITNRQQQSIDHIINSDSHDMESIHKPSTDSLSSHPEIVPFHPIPPFIPNITIGQIRDPPAAHLQKSQTDKASASNNNNPDTGTDIYSNTDIDSNPVDSPESVPESQSSAIRTRSEPSIDTSAAADQCSPINKQKFIEDSRRLNHLHRPQPETASHSAKDPIDHNYSKAPDYTGYDSVDVDFNNDSDSNDPLLPQVISASVTLELNTDPSNTNSSLFRLTAFPLCILIVLSCSLFIGICCYNRYSNSSGDNSNRINNISSREKERLLNPNQYHDHYQNIV